LGDDVVAKCVSNLKNKAALDAQKGANLGLKCVRMCLDPLGELDPLAAIRVGGCLLLRGGKGREWEREGRDGKGEGRKGRGGEGKGGPPSLIGKVQRWQP